MRTYIGTLIAGLTLMYIFVKAITRIYILKCYVLRCIRDNIKKNDDSVHRSKYLPS